MTKYTTAPVRAAYWDHSVGTVFQPETVNVYELDHAPRDTRLLDHKGQKIYAVDEREPIGFAITKP